MKKKILITSVGSLVGQNILDVLENRREDLIVVGLNSIADNARNFRCDKAYLVPPIKDRENFDITFMEIFSIEMPDMVLAGRDNDVVFLAEFREKNPAHAHRFPYGPQQLALSMYDKYLTHEFTLRNDLPFADTLLYRSHDDNKKLSAFAARHGFPLICKPRSGFASLNVFFVTNQDQLDRMKNSGEEFMLQEYLCPDANFQDYAESYSKGMPIFFQIPDKHHYAAQTVIGKGGEILGTIKTKHVLSAGKAELSEIYSNKKIDDLVSQYVKAISRAGWVGFFNMQYKPDKNGRWKVFELNPRLVGATSTRYLFGFDELGMLIKSFYPSWEFPANPHKNPPGKVHKYITDFFVSNEDVAILTEKGSWQKSLRDEEHPQIVAADRRQ